MVNMVDLNQLAALPGRFPFIRVLMPFSTRFCFSLLFPMFCCRAVTAPFLRVLRGFIGPKYPEPESPLLRLLISRRAPSIRARDCPVERFPSACVLLFLPLLQGVFRPDCVLRSACVLPYSLPTGTDFQGKSNLPRRKYNIYIFL